MLPVYALSLLVAALAAVWLRRQGRERSRLAWALYLSLVWGGLRALLLVAGWPEDPDLLVTLLLQSVAWAILLWGLELRVLTIVSGLLAALTAALLWPDTVSALLHWGYVTAVPLAAVAYVRERTIRLPDLAGGRTGRPAPNRALWSADRVADQHAILDVLLDGILVGDRQGLVAYANPAAAAILGIPAAALSGRRLAEILDRLPPPAGGDEPAAPADFEANGRLVRGQAITLYDPVRAPQGALVILREVTAEYQAERAKSAFLTSISHELRTPLTAIKGYVELLQMGSAGELSADQKTLLVPIQRNATRMVQLVNSLIFASSARGGRLEIAAGQADLRQIARQISREMEAIAAQTQQTVIVETDSRLPAVQADPIHVATVLQELVANAIKYNRPGGEVRIGLALQSHGRPPDGFAVVTISDEGIGIAPADQRRIFEAFYRPDQRDDEVRVGRIGVGLSIVRALVGAYGGRIWLESVPGQGSRFTFILPISQPEAPFPLS